MRRTVRVIPVAFALLLIFGLAAAMAALTFPTLTGRVVDQANIIPAADKASLTDKLAALEDKTSDQLVVVTLNSLQGTDIADYGYQLGRAWGIGQKDKNNGVLLIVAPTEHKVRIEVGYGLEGDLTDAVTKLIIENSILPRFRANDMPGGIARGVDDIIQVLTGDAAAFKERAAKRPESKDGFFPIFVPFVLIFILTVVLRAIFGRGHGYVGRRGGGTWLGGSGGSSGWSSGSSGGFSGGGGSFGGGGSSGSW